MKSFKEKKLAEIKKKFPDFLIDNNGKRYLDGVCLDDWISDTINATLNEVEKKIKKELMGKMPVWIDEIIKEMKK